MSKFGVKISSGFRLPSLTICGGVTVTKHDFVYIPIEKLAEAKAVNQSFPNALTFQGGDIIVPSELTKESEHEVEEPKQVDTPRWVGILLSKGVDTSALPKMTDEAITAIPGIGKTILAKIREEYPYEGD